MDRSIFAGQERRIIEKLNTPKKLQEYINKELRYNFEENGSTTRSFRRVLRDKTAHCLEGALFATAILYYHGHLPLIVCMEARDIDHNIAIYRVNRRWGAVAQSRDSNLKGRSPVHRKIKDLVMSYHPYYWDFFSEDKDITSLTMRGYARVDLRQFGTGWITSEQNLDNIEDVLWDEKYRFLFPRKDKPRFYRVDRKTQKIIFLNPQTLNNLIQSTRHGKRHRKAQEE